MPILHQGGTFGRQKYPKPLGKRCGIAAQVSPDPSALCAPVTWWRGKALTTRMLRRESTQPSENATVPAFKNILCGCARTGVRGFACSLLLPPGSARKESPQRGSLICLPLRGRGTTAGGGGSCRRAKPAGKRPFVLLIQGALLLLLLLLCEGMDKIVIFCRQNAVKIRKNSYFFGRLRVAL